MDIVDFLPGDTITRVEPSVSGSTDYMGDKMILLSLSGGKIFLLSDKLVKSLGDSLILDLVALPAHDYTKGWDYYIDKAGFDSEKCLIKKVLTRAVKKAIVLEDYEFLAQMDRLFKDAHQWQI